MRLGPTRMTGAASAITGSGAGPRQAISLSLGTGIRSLTFELRTTWFQGAPIDTSRTPVDSEPLPLLPGGSRTYDGHYTDGELHARRRLGPTGLRVTGGLRFGGDSHGPRRWLFGELDLPLWRRFGLLAAGGVRPERADLAQPGGRFAQLALRMDMSSPRPELARAPRPDLAAPAATAVLPLAKGRYLLRFYLPGAQRVELKGDLTDWQVVALRRSSAGAGLWETTVEKPAGVYHVNIRVDGGEWTAPQGLAAVPDRFGGSAGVLALPPFQEEDHANGTTPAHHPRRNPRARHPGSLRLRADRGPGLRPRRRRHRLRHAPARRPRRR